MNARFSLSLLGLAATLGAQSVILPSAVATTRPTSSTFYTGNVFYSTSSTTIPHDSHAQLIYDVADIAPPVATWNGLSVRRPTGLGNANQAITTNANIQMSVSSLHYSATTTTFASNHGTITTVLNAPVNLQAQTNPPTWPAPWEPPFPFSTPFVYVGASGLSLVVDIYQTGNSGTAPWYVEAWYPDTGARASNPSAQSSCRFSNGNYNNSISYRFPVVGGTWYVSYGSVLPNTFGFAAIGTQGAGGTWNGIPLPLNLSFLGATGCNWATSDDLIVVPISSTASGSASWPTNLVQIPNHPSFGGQVFYDHAALSDPAANAFGFVTTWSSKWTIGTNRGQPGAFVYATGNSAANATGTRTNEACVTVQLN